MPRISQGAGGYTVSPRTVPGSFSAPRAAPTPQAGTGGVAGLNPRTLNFDGNNDTAPMAVKLELIDNLTFAAKFQYNEALKDFIRHLEPPMTSRWDPQRRAWTMPLSSYNEVVTALRTQAPVPVNISPIPRSLLEQTLRGGAVGGSSSEPMRAPSSEVANRLHRITPLWDRLYDFQRESVRFGLERCGRVLLGDDMGLGKTVQALAVAACYGPDDWPLIIVTPSTMKLVWLDAVRTWLPPSLQPAEEDLLVVNDGKTATERLALLAQPSMRYPGTPPIRPKIVIISYDMVKRVLSSLRELKPHTIIADESHHLKSPNAQRTRAMQALVSVARRAIFVSGTPALSRPIELYPQLDMLRPGLFGSLDEFGMRYCAGVPALNPRFSTSPSGYDFRGASCLDELKLRLERDILIRRTKAQVLTQLPEKIRKRVPVEASPESLPDLEAVKAQLAGLERAVETGSMHQLEADMERQRLVSEFFRVTGPSKVPEVLMHVQALLDAGKKVLVFAHHKEVLDRLQQGLDFSGCGTGRSGGDDDVINLADEEEEESEIDDDDDWEDGTRGALRKRKKKSRKVTARKKSRGGTIDNNINGESSKSARTGSSSGVGRCVRIDGSVSNERRKAAVDAFQQDPAVRAALLSINAAGVGLTLTAASVVVFAELWWTPGALIQAEDRAHRLGQRGELEVHYCTAVDTADDLIWRTIKDKLGVVSSVLESNGGGRGSNVFADMRYAQRYESVQQRLAEEAELGGGGAGSGSPPLRFVNQNGRRSQHDGEGTGIGRDMPRLHSVSSDITLENPGAAYAEVAVESDDEEESTEYVRVVEERNVPQSSAGVGVGDGGRQRRRCEGCNVEGTGSLKLMMCARCRDARYCSQECQERDWRRHKATCKRVRQGG